jgi:hypothetical protein
MVQGLKVVFSVPISSVPKAMYDSLKNMSLQVLQVTNDQGSDEQTKKDRYRRIFTHTFTTGPFNSSFTLTYGQAVTVCMNL